MEPIVTNNKLEQQNCIATTLGEHVSKSRCWRWKFKVQVCEDQSLYQTCQECQECENAGCAPVQAKCFWYNMEWYWQCYFMLFFLGRLYNGCCYCKKSALWQDMSQAVATPPAPFECQAPPPSRWSSTSSTVRMHPFTSQQIILNWIDANTTKA